ncbi:RING finger protein 212B-like isoform X2 [Parambassis ranga]|nr:RING finger protein 212B isoform X2 [Parambassis ranga]XP_028283632.1 RING finger protein 212B isoform X2 [Parambassis ranga]
MKPQEKVFFQDPVKLIQSRLEHISQIATFQRMQMERVIAHFKHKAAELDRRLKEVTEQSYRQLSELQKENADLKKQLSHLQKEIAALKRPLAQRRVSPGWFQTEGHSAQRMALPVAITSPVTPRSRMSSIGSAESQRWTRTRDPSLSLTTPGSAASLRETMTPTAFSTPTRTQTPNVFQFMSGLSIQSPRH